MKIAKTKDELPSHFLYLSHTKLMALHEQLAQSRRRRLSWKLTLNIGFAKAEVSMNLEGSNNYLILDDVLKALRKHKQIGTIDDPLDYFEGNLLMNWGLYQDCGRPDAEPPLVYFGGETKKMIVGLGGSTRHVIGFSGTSSTGSRSVTPLLVGHILAGIGIERKGWYAHTTRGLNSDVVEAMAWANRYFRDAPKQRLVFVAKTLLKGATYHDIAGKPLPHPGVLGTPLFVSMVNYTTPDTGIPL